MTETKPMLKFVVPVKKLEINGKHIKIPKMGIKQHRLLKDVRSCDETLKILLDSICPGLNAAESELVMLNLCAFNGKCLEEKDGLKLSDVYICTETEFELNGKTFKFKNPMYTSDPIIDDADFLSHHYHDPSVDFHDFPAFIMDWATGLRKTIALDTPEGTIYGGINILDRLS